MSLVNRFALNSNLKSAARAIVFAITISAAALFTSSCGGGGGGTSLPYKGIGGQPPQDDIQPAATQQMRVSAGFTHSCAITTSGGVKCWRNQRTHEIRANIICAALLYYVHTNVIS